MRIFLTGFMGCGKSTVGKKLASKLGYSFIDLDDYVEKKAGCPVPEIFEKHGEAYFRKLETYTLKEISSMENIVISTGGGTPCHDNNMKLINSSGISIYLKMSADTLFNRLINSKKGRPLIENFNEQELKEYIHEKLLDREFYYSQSHFKVKAKDLKPDELHKFLIQRVL